MMRKATKQSPGPNSAEKAYHRWVKESERCIACLAPVYVPILHHAEGATFKHLKTLVGHWFSFGLCQRCDDVVTRQSRRVFREYLGTSQAAVWKESIGRYEAETGAIVPEDIKRAIADWNR